MDVNLEILIALIAVGGVVLGAILGSALTYAFGQRAAKRARRERITDDLRDRMRDHWAKVVLAIDDALNAVGHRDEWIEAYKNLERALDATRVDAGSDDWKIIGAITMARDLAPALADDPREALVGLAQTKSLLQLWLKGDLPTDRAVTDIQFSTDKRIAEHMATAPPAETPRRSFWAWWTEIV